jgi:hypothetical protein
MDITLLSLILMKKLINSKLCLKKPQKLLMICLLHLFYLIGLSFQIFLHLRWMVLQGLIGLQTARYCLQGHHPVPLLLEGVHLLLLLQGVHLLLLLQGVHLLLLLQGVNLLLPVQNLCLPLMYH